jgi:hypothetical protein
LRTYECTRNVFLFFFYFFFCWPGNQLSSTFRRPGSSYVRLHTSFRQNIYASKCTLSHFLDWENKNESEILWADWSYFYSASDLCVKVQNDGKNLLRFSITLFFAYAQMLIVKRRQEQYFMLKKKTKQFISDRDQKKNCHSSEIVRMEFPFRGSNMEKANTWCTRKMTFFFVSFCYDQRSV